MLCPMECIDDILAVSIDPRDPIPYRTGEKDDGVPYVKLISDRIKTEDEVGQSR